MNLWSSCTVSTLALIEETVCVAENRRAAPSHLHPCREGESRHPIFGQSASEPFAWQGVQPLTGFSYLQPAYGLKKYHCTWKDASVLIHNSSSTGQYLPESNAALALQRLQEQAVQFVLVQMALLLKPWSWHISPTYGELNLIRELYPKNTWGLDKAALGQSRASSTPQKEKVTSTCQNGDGRWSSSIFLLCTYQAALGHGSRGEYWGTRMRFGCCSFLSWPFSSEFKLTGPGSCNRENFGLKISTMS